MKCQDLFSRNIQNKMASAAFVISTLMVNPSAGQTKTNTCEDRVHPDETAHQDLHCLPFCFNF